MRLIDADALLKTFYRELDNAILYGRIVKPLQELIKEAPSVDAVPVVRCKDCKCGDTGIDEEGKSFWKCIGIHYGGTKSMNFCSYGERRDDE